MKPNQLARIAINFPIKREFKASELRELQGVIGLYFISLRSQKINYPFGTSSLLYIGMSEKSTNSIGARLMEHFTGASGNIGLQNYRKTMGTEFTYLNFEMIKPSWENSIENLESYFILDFVSRYGVYPICNNKSGFPQFSDAETNRFEIDWSFYE